MTYEEEEEKWLRAMEVAKRLTDHSWKVQDIIDAFDYLPSIYNWFVEKENGKRIEIKGTIEDLTPYKDCKCDFVGKDYTDYYTDTYGNGRECQWQLITCYING